ncbi:MAG: hypothetical protein WD022_03880, partial [Balneolaceae bacterium]
MRSIIPIFAFLVSLGLSMPGMAQDFYPGNYFYMVAEDGQPFFFQPSEFSPLQTGAFDVVSLSVSDHPLSAINRNPANMNRLSGKGFAYLDVKTLPEENVTPYFRCEACFMSEMAYIYVPEPTPKKSQEPFLSAALFLKPLANERFNLGFTYQFMQMNESFYQRVGYPYGFSMITPHVGRYAADGQRPFFGEEDYFNKYGHFPAIFAGYSFSNFLNAAFKISYNTYRGDGSMLSDNFGQADIAPNPQSNIFDRNRLTDYSHWDFSAGLNVQLNNMMDAGLTAGVLVGDFNQVGREQYLQNYLNTEHPTYEDYYYRYDSYFNQRDGFSREGQTWYTAVEYNWKPQDTRSFRLFYRGSRSLQDFSYGLNTSTRGSFESHTLQSSEEEVFWISEDERAIYTNGTGDLAEWRNQGGIFMTQDFAYGFQLKTGLQMAYVSTNETVSELFKNHFLDNSFEQIDDGPLTESQYRYMQTRDLSLTQNFYEFTGYIPLILRKSFGKQFSAEAGILATHQQFIRKYDQYFLYENEYFNTEDDITDTEGDQNGYSSNERTLELHTHFNAYGSVVFSPFDQFKLRIMTFSDRRQLNSVSNLDA